MMIDWLIVIVAAVVRAVEEVAVTGIGERDRIATLEAKTAVFNTATPLERVIFPRSSPVVVSKKSTVPVGVPEPGAFAVTLR